MNAHDTPSGTKMMWNIKVNAICALAHGTGSTAARTAVPPNVAITLTTAFLRIVFWIVDGDGRSTSPSAGQRRGSGNSMISSAFMHEPFDYSAHGASDSVKAKWRLRAKH